MFSKRTFVAFWFSSFTLFGLPVPQDQSDQQTTPVGPIQRVYVEERTTAGTGIRFTVISKARASHESENAQAVSVEVKTKCPAALASTKQLRYGRLLSANLP